MNNIPSELISFAIGFGPSIIFVLMILWGLLIGYFRGFRKSLVFLIHAFIAFNICFILFLTLANNHDFDKFLVTTINKFGGENFIQNTLKVSSDCETFREMFYEFIPKQMSLVDGIALILKDNGNYLDALVDMAYRIVFAVVLMLLYNFLIFIMWIIYLIFYNNKKYINKYMYLYEKGEIDRKYEKRRFSGMAISGLRKIVSGLIFLSFVGTAYYIISGDIGTEQQKNIKFEDENVNLVYGAYSSVSSYGSQGIFKILNSCRDSNDIPYYLFAADLVFQGSIKNATTGVTQNVYFRDELAQYIKFTKSTFNLLIKYDENNLIERINNGNLDNAYIMETLSKMFKNESFVEEFDIIIEEFDTNSYFINLGFSLMDTIMNNIDKMEFLKNVDEKTLEPLKIMFTDGYYSKAIPYEAKLYEESLKNHDMPYTLKTIRPSDLLTSDDIKIIFDILGVYLKNSETESSNPTKAIMATIPYIKELSILSGNRKEELNPVFKRLIAYVKYSLLGGDSQYIKSNDDFSTEFYISKAYDNVSWIDELNIISNVASDVLDLYNDNFVENKNIFGAIVSLYDSKNSSYYRYQDTINKLVNYLSSSYALSYVLSSSLVLDNILNSLVTTVPNMTIPDSISLGNSYDEIGRITSYGELYYLIMGLDAFLSQKDTAIVLNDIISGNISDTSYLLETLFNALNNVENGLKVSESIVGSDILTSMFSGVLTDESLFKDFKIYIDDSVYENLDAKIIKKEELALLFDNGTTLIDLANPIIKGEAVGNDFYIDLIQNEKLLNILDSKIIEGTFSSLISNYLDTNEFIVMPQSFIDKNGYISIGSKDSEVKKIIKAVIDTSLDLNLIINGMNNDSLKNDLTNMIINLKEEELNKIFESNILHYSISNYLIEHGNNMLGELSVIIPNDVCNMLENDTVLKVIKKNELINFFISVQKIFPTTTEIMANDLLALLCRNTEVMENEIISVTLAKAIADDASSTDKKLGDLTNVLEIPTRFNASNLGRAEYLGENFNKSNPWYFEAQALVNALEEILQFKSNPDKHLSGNVDEITNEIMSIFKTLNEPHNKYTTETKLDYIYRSEIFVATLSKQINNTNLLDSLSDHVIDSIQDKEYKKGFYTFKKNEIKSLIDIVNLYDISITDSDVSSKIDEIASDVSNDVLGIVNELTIEEKEKIHISPDATKTKLDVLYSSSIVKEILTSELDNILLTNNLASLDSLSLDENENFDTRKASLVKDSFGYYKEDEIKSLVNLLDILGYDINGDNEITEESLGNLLNQHENTKISNLRYLYNQYITSIIIYNALNNITNSFSFEIPNDAKIYKDSVYFDALKYEEAYAMLVYTKEIGLDSIDVENMDLAKIEANIDTLANSRLVSSMMYGVIKSNVDSIVVPLDALDSSRRYIKLDEFNRFLAILTNNKDSIFSKNENGNYNLTKLMINSESLDIDTIISICEGESYVFTATVVTVLIGNIDSIEGLVMPYHFYEAGSKEAFEAKTNNIWLTSLELHKLASGGKILGIDLSNVEEKTISDIDYTSMSDSDIDTITSSQILRATITYCIRINNKPASTIFSKKYVYTLDRYKAGGKEKICSLSQEEVVKSIKAIQAINNVKGTKGLAVGFEFTDLQNLDQEIINIMMSSGIFRCQISSVILSYPAAAIFGLGEEETIIYLNDATTKKEKILTENEAITILNTLKMSSI